jgi:hypothetical protein
MTSFVRFFLSIEGFILGRFLLIDSITAAPGSPDYCERCRRGRRSL